MFRVGYWVFLSIPEFPGAREGRPYNLTFLREALN